MRPSTTWTLSLLSALIGLGVGWRLGEVQTRESLELELMSQIETEMMAPAMTILEQDISVLLPTLAEDAKVEEGRALLNLMQDGSLLERTYVESLTTLVQSYYEELTGDLLPATNFSIKPASGRFIVTYQGESFHAILTGENDALELQSAQVWIESTDEAAVLEVYPFYQLLLRLMGESSLNPKQALATWLVSSEASLPNFDLPYAELTDEFEHSLYYTGDRLLTYLINKTPVTIED